MNTATLALLGVNLEKRDECEINYVEEMLENYRQTANLNVSTFVSGIGHIQAAICDEYIAIIDAKQYASDMECFVPLMEKFNQTYGRYLKYPVEDAGNGSYNNYIYCEGHGMENL